MASYSRTVETTASPEKVWGIWTDLSTWKDWNPDVLSASLPGAFGSGAEGEMRTKSGGHHKIVLQDVEPGRAFTVIAGPLPLTKIHFRCEVEPAAGGSRLSQSVTVHGLMSIMAGQIGPRIAATFEELLGGLARYSEGEA